MRTVAEILEKKGRNVYWIDPLASVYDALKMMHEKNVGALCVMIEGYLVGIVSERDYVRKVILDRHASQQTKVSEIMTREVIQVAPEVEVDDCLELMKDNRIRHLPVVEQGKVQGVLSLRDLFVDAIDALRAGEAGTAGS